MGWPRAKTATEDGFTIVEVMVALSLMAIAMVAVSGVFFSGLKAASAINTRTAAVALATRETEAIRAVPYDAIGFYDDQDDQVGSFETLPTVSLGATNATPATTRLAPTGMETVGPVDYSIRRHLLWVGAKGPAAATYPEAYKKTVVILTWTDGSGPHTLRQDSIVYPGGRGVYAGLGSTGTTSPPAPAAVPPGPATILSVAPTDPLGHNQLEVTWSLPTTGDAVTELIVQWSTDATFLSGTASSIPQPATATTYQALGLAPSTTYYFRVVAHSSPTLSSTSASAFASTLAEPAATACQVTSLTLSGQGTAPLGLATKTYLKQGNNRLDENLELVLTYSGSCTGSFSVQGTSGGGVASLGSPYPLLGSGGTRSATILKSSTSWPAVGMHTFTVVKDASVLDPPVTKTFLFCGSTNNPSPDANTC